MTALRPVGLLDVLYKYVAEASVAGLVQACLACAPHEDRRHHHLAT